VNRSRESYLLRQQLPADHLRPDQLVHALDRMGGVLGADWTGVPFYPISSLCSVDSSEEENQALTVPM